MEGGFLLGTLASKKYGLAAQVTIDGKLFGNDGKPLKVPRCGEGLDTIQGKPVGASCMHNTIPVDSCAIDHINSSLAAHVIVIIPSLNGIKNTLKPSLNMGLDLNVTKK
nr:hypothetical protein [Tanacetum cinerariifolium]GFA29959.1 hypothetical protein [Tanacetum cinerariifolium]